MSDRLAWRRVGADATRRAAIRKAQQAVRDLGGGYVPIAHDDSDEGALTVC